MHPHRRSLLLFLLVLPGWAIAQNNFFTDLGAKTTVPLTGSRVIIPVSFRTVGADWAALKNFLRRLPDEKASGFNRVSAPVFSLVKPDGSIVRFRAWESSIQEPALQAKFPDIRTYLGQGLDDPYATIRFDIGPRGFHAQVLSPNGSWYIDPYAVKDTLHYISYYRSDLQRSGTMQCELPNDPVTFRTEATQAACLGTQLRTYRLAVACTGEYAQAPGISAGANAAVLHNAIVTSVNRVVGVYEQEVAVRLVLVGTNNLIEFLNAATDPFTGNNSSATLIGESQTVITANIGTANFDIGHTFSTGGGGLASLGCVCSSTNKARGITGSSAPTGDSYDIDYVAHEMGHQFGGNHTFNSTTSSCGGGNRNGGTAYEVGSGTTIQAYAGICTTDNIQPHSDPFFHAISFDEISNFIVGGGGAGCAIVTSTGNAAPVIAALPNNNLTIPVSTPFTLTGSASDANGDPLTYCWEEWDIGGSGTWNSGATSTTAPLFKSRIPKTTGVRVFPDMAVILAGYPANPAAAMDGLKGETLASVARSMKFRLTVRDNRAGGGGVVSAGSGCQSATAFTVSTSGSTPFTVTVPNGGESYPGGSTQTVTWNAAGTTAAPFNTPNVKITLSTDGGLTYPTVLLASTPNDGSEIVTMPAVTTSTARIKVEAVENIFFDISNANFSITAAVGCILNCPSNIVVSNTPGMCGAVVNFPAISASPGCGTVSTNPVSGSFFPVGNTIVTVSTASGSSCFFTVTVKDTEAPVMSCPSNITVAADPGTCGAVVNFTLPGASDNCTASPVITASPLSGSLFPPGVNTVTVTAADNSADSPNAVCSFTITVTNTRTASISGGATVMQDPAGNSTVSFTGSGGAPNYTFFYTLNGGPVQSVSTVNGLNTASVVQTHATAGTFQYTLVSVTDATGCNGQVTGNASVTITVTPAPSGPDLTDSQFFSSTQVATGGTINEVIAIRNVGTGPTTAPIVFSVTNYAPITGLTALPNPDPSVTIGFTTFALNIANWVTSSNASALTFTSVPGFVLAPGSSVYLGVRIQRAGGSNGSVTHSATIAAGTGGGDLLGINNSISNTLLKN